MGKVKTLILIRHGESTRNRAKGKAWFTDPVERDTFRPIRDYEVPLTEKGRQQARRIGSAMESGGYPDFEAIYHSGYKRTKQTAIEIMENSPFFPRVFAASLLIRERDAGYGYNMLEEEFYKTFPYMETYWKETGSFFARPPGGESFADLMPRVQLFLNMIHQEHADQTVLVVSHGGTIRAFRAILENLSAAGCNQLHSISNCGRLSYRFTAEGVSFTSEEDCAKVDRR